MYIYIKRIFDIIFSLLGLLFLWPLFLVIAISIKLDSDGPVIFKQKRYGKNKELFTIYKFRSMEVSSPENTSTWELENVEHHITNVGRFLRKTSLDELPQFINILKGEMSFIGYRPVILTEEKLTYVRDLYNVHDVKPGITGLAQINGRDHLSNDEKAKFDGIYAANIGFLNDIKIVLNTILYVLKSEDISEGLNLEIKKNNEKYYK